MEEGRGSRNWEWDANYSPKSSKHQAQILLRLRLQTCCDRIRSPRHFLLRDHHFQHLLSNKEKISNELGRSQLTLLLGQ